jgi:hypothetical protein
MPNIFARLASVAEVLEDRGQAWWKGSRSSSVCCGKGAEAG